MGALCPKCNAVVPAIVCDINLISICPKCGDSSGRLEINKEFFDKFGFNRHTDIYNSVMINITDECNDTCALCFYPCKDDSHKNTEWIYKQAQKYGNKRIWFSGGEPTCHPDLMEIICNTPNFTSMVTNGMRFSSMGYLKKFIDATGLDEYGCIRAVMSIHPRMPEYKHRALSNMRELGVKMFCGMFSVQTVDDIPEILDIWINNIDVLTNCRIRTPFNSWMQSSEKILFLSEVYDKVKELLPEFEITEVFGGNSIFNVNLESQGRYINICSAPGKDAFPISPLDNAPKMLANDGNIYATPYALRVNEAMSCIA